MKKYEDIWRDLKRDVNLSAYASQAGCDVKESGNSAQDLHHTNVLWMILAKNHFRFHKLSMNDFG